MNQKIIIIVVIILIVWYIYHNFFSNNSKDITLISENYNNKTPKIINFNASWCGWSQKLEPVWTKLINDMKNKNIDVLDIKCDLDKNKEICNKYEIDGYPMIKLFVDDQIHDYHGDRSLDDIKKFIEEKI